MSDEDRVSTVSSPKTETEIETGGFQDQDQDQDSEVPRPRPRPRLVKTGLETSRDQDSSLENSKSDSWEIFYLTIFMFKYSMTKADNDIKQRDHYAKAWHHKMCNIKYLTTEIELVLPNFKSPGLFTKL